MELDDLFGYYTPKVVWVRNRNLGCLRLILVLGILVYIIYGVIILKHEYNRVEVPLGTVEISLQAPNRVVDPTQFPYCQQYAGNDSVSQLYTRRTCFALYALEVLYPFEDSGGVFITTRISTQPNRRICALDQACNNEYDPIGPAVTGFVADVESFTLRIRHSMQALKLYSEYRSPKYAGNSDTMTGRLRRSDGSVMKTITSPIFAIGELLQAAAVNLEAESDAAGAQNTSMRDSGIILLVTLAYSNEDTELPEFDMQISRVAFSEYKISHLDRLNDTAVNIVGLHGIKMVFQQTGTIVRFDFQVLLISIVTASALLAAATSVVEFIMLKVSPLRALYAEAKFEPTMEIHELEDLKRILQKQPALRRVKGDRLLTLSQFAHRQYQAQDRKPNCSKEEIGAIARSIHQFRLDQEREEEEERIRMEQMAKKAGCCGWCCPKKPPRNQESEEGLQLTNKQFAATQHEKVFNLLSKGDSTVPQEQFETLLAVAEADSATKQLLAENGFQGNLTHDQTIDALTFLGQLEKVRLAAGVPCVALFSDEDALDRLYDKLTRYMHTAPVLTPASPIASNVHSEEPLPETTSHVSMCRQS